MATKFARTHRRVRQYSQRTITWAQRIVCFIVAIGITYMLLMIVHTVRRDMDHQKALVSYYRDSCNKRSTLVATTVDMSSGRIRCTYRNTARTIFASVSEETYLKRLHRK